MARRERSLRAFLRFGQMLKTCKLGIHQYSGRQCAECKRATEAKYRTVHAGVRQAQKVSWRRNNLKRHNTSNAAWLARNPEYANWRAMITRCTDPKAEGFEHYQRFGISVCEQWQGKDGYLNFLADMGPRPSAEYSLDREDNDGNYEPGNCRWATDIQQNRNRRNNRLLTYSGRTQCAAAWAEELGINVFTMRKRLASGWPIERVITEPVCSSKSRKRA